MLILDKIKIISLIIYFYLLLIIFTFKLIFTYLNTGSFHFDLHILTSVKYGFKNGSNLV